MDQANRAQSMHNISVFLLFSLYFQFVMQYYLLGSLFLGNCRRSPRWPTLGCSREAPYMLITENVAWIVFCSVNIFQHSLQHSLPYSGQWTQRLWNLTSHGTLADYSSQTSCASYVNLQ